jgi:hypothetical protein
VYNLKEKAHKLIDSLPADKLIYVVAILTGMKGLIIDEEGPDEFDLLLIADSKIDNDETMDLDDFAAKLGYA